MDATTFDRLVRAFASSNPRRRLLGLLTALPLGGVLSSFGDEEAAAKRRNKNNHKQKNNKNNKNKNKNKRKNKRKNKNKRQNTPPTGGGDGGGQGPATPPPATPPPPPPPPIGDPGSCIANGGACQQSSDCCGGNCFGQVCTTAAHPVRGHELPGRSHRLLRGRWLLPAAGQPMQYAGGQPGCAVPPTAAAAPAAPMAAATLALCGTCPAGQTCDAATGQCQGACNPTTCPNGCCDEEDECQDGDSGSECGTGGVRLRQVRRWQPLHRISAAPATPTVVAGSVARTAAAAAVGRVRRGRSVTRTMGSACAPRRAVPVAAAPTTRASRARCQAGTTTQFCGIRWSGVQGVRRRRGLLQWAVRGM